MSHSLMLACLWVIAATVTAFLPMRRQFPPGIVLLVSAPFLIGYIGHQHGVVWVGIALLAFLSMFRRPLRALLRYVRRRIAGEAR